MLEAMHQFFAIAVAKRLSSAVKYIDAASGFFFVVGTGIFGENGDGVKLNPGRSSGQDRS
jgi:hypothetical protein